MNKYVQLFLVLVYCLITGSCIFLYAYLKLWVLLILIVLSAFTAFQFAMLPTEGERGIYKKGK